MPSPAKRSIPWDIFQEHLDEAAFLWEQWEVALEAANYTLAEVIAGPESRLRAHLDGLVLGNKPVAERLLLPALDGEPELARPAAWALLAAEDADHLDAVLAALAAAEPPKTLLLARALGLSNHPAVVPRLSALWAGAQAPVRALILTVMERRDLAWAGAQLPVTLAAAEPALLLPSLRVLRRVGARDPAVLTYLEYALVSPDAAVRAEAIATGVLLGARTAWEACRREVVAPGAGPLPFAVLALGTQPADRLLLHERLRDPATRRHALWALGFAGDVEAADAAAQLCGDEELGPLAGEALSIITGLAIDGPFRTPGKTEGPGTNDVDPDAPPPEVRAEDHLIAPNPVAVEAWWREQRARYKPGQRFLGGQPRGPESLRAALLELAMWRRPVLALELAMVSRAPEALDVHRWGHQQLLDLAAAPAPSPRAASARR